MHLLLMIMITSPVAAQTTAPVNDLAGMINQAIFAVISAFLLFVVNAVKAYITAQLKKANHERGVAVIQDAFYSALADQNITLLQAQSDKAAKQLLDTAWLRISVARLEDLSGFKKANLSGWAQEQINIFWGKLAAGKA